MWLHKFSTWWVVWINTFVLIIECWSWWLAEIWSLSQCICRWLGCWVTLFIFWINWAFWIWLHKFTVWWVVAVNTLIIICPGWGWWLAEIWSLRKVLVSWIFNHLISTYNKCTLDESSFLWCFHLLFFGLSFLSLCGSFCLFLLTISLMSWLLFWPTIRAFQWVLKTHIISNSWGDVCVNAFIFILEGWISWSTKNWS